MTVASVPSAEKPRLLCIGMPVRDLVFHIETLPRRGGKVPAHRYEEIAGGNALNAAIAIARLGGRPMLSGPTGDAGDKASAYIADKLRDEGIDGNSLVPMPGLVTPISNIMIDPSGERTIVTFRDPRLWDVTLPDADELLRDCAALLVESRCASFTTDLCAKASARGIPVVVDADTTMSLREGLLTVATHLVFSQEALHATTDLTDDLDALRRIAAITPAFVAVTTGAQGVTWLDNGEARHLPSFPVHTVDTLGAGDVFHGAFALAMAERQGIRDAMRFAAAAAAIKCSRYGGAFGAPYRMEVVEFIGNSPIISPDQDTATL